MDKDQEPETETKSPKRVKLKRMKSTESKMRPSLEL